jgi:hypothetical protein
MLRTCSDKNCRLKWSISARKEGVVKAWPASKKPNQNRVTGKDARLTKTPMDLLKQKYQARGSATM